MRATAQLREGRSAATTNKLQSAARPCRPGGAPVAPRSAAAAAAVAAASSSPPPPPSSTVLLKVDGMVCSKCTDRVENALMATDGVKDARADLASGEVRVELVEAADGAAAAPSAAALAAAVEELGFGAVVA